MQHELTLERLSQIHGSAVYDASGEKIGKVDEIYYDEDTRQPEWIGIGLGFFGQKHVVVPVQGAEFAEDGITVPYAKSQVKDSPDVDADEISEQTEAELYDHYGVDRGAVGEPAAGSPSSRDMADEGDRSLTRSEEELAVGKREQEIGRARLRKWVETVPVEAEVELREERVRVERQPVDEPVTGAQIGEETIETTLRGEEAVVDKRTVAKERISLEKDVDTHTESVSDELRKERVEVEGDATDTRSRNPA